MVWAGLYTQSNVRANAGRADRSWPLFRNCEGAKCRLCVRLSHTADRVRPFRGFRVFFLESFVVNGKSGPLRPRKTDTKIHEKEELERLTGRRLIGLTAVRSELYHRRFLESFSRRGDRVRNLRCSISIPLSSSNWPAPRRNPCRPLRPCPSPALSRSSAAAPRW